MHLDEIIEQGRVVLMDGSTSQELARQTQELCQPQQLQQAVLSHPGAVEQAHTMFIQAGAQVVLSGRSEGRSRQVAEQLPQQGD